ncbi:hypothetical protein KFU94_43250 [Chloroflexi bacterium TSY]|nr:hypothetical protein [Chloroflexi bacterium TSY]
MSGISTLYNLQKIDIELDKVRRRVLEIQKLLGESAELKQARQKFENIHSALQEWESRQKDSELESQTITAKIEETDAKLMSGEITNPKELESLQANLDALGRQRESVDDISVQAMVKIDELKDQMAAAQKNVVDIEKNWKEQQKSIMSEGRQLKGQFQHYKEQRESMAGLVGASLLAQYNDIRKRKAGIAVSHLDGDSCGACNMQVPSGVASSARSNDADFVTCPSCGRILYGG